MSQGSKFFFFHVVNHLSPCYLLSRLLFFQLNCLGIFLKKLVMGVFLLFPFWLISMSQVYMNIGVKTGNIKKFLIMKQPKVIKKSNLQWIWDISGSLTHEGSSNFNIALVLCTQHRHIFLCMHTIPTNTFAQIWS